MGYRRGPLSIAVGSNLGVSWVECKHCYVARVMFCQTAEKIIIIYAEVHVRIYVSS